MSKLSLVIPSVGFLNTVACPEVDTALSTIQTWANGEIEGTNNIKAEGVTEANLTAAVQALLNTKSFAALTYTLKNVAETTAASGELIAMAKEASTVKLPAATANRIVGVFAGNSLKEVKITAPVANTIYGGPTVAQTTITLAANQCVIMQADGTNWLIIAGLPKGTSTYSAVTLFTKAEGEAGVEPSATRPAHVILRNTSGSAATCTVGGVTMNAFAAEELREFYMNPGQKWVFSQASSEQHILL